MATKTLEAFIEHKGRTGKSLSKPFYDLSLEDKFAIIEEYQERTGRLISDGTTPVDQALYDKLVKAVLQHSSPSMKQNYPVPGVANHTISRKARVGDKITKAQRQQEVHTALLDAFDRIEGALTRQDG